MSLRSEFICATVADSINNEICNCDYKDSIHVEVESDNYYFEIDAELKWEMLNYHEWDDGMECDWDNGGECQSMQVFYAKYTDEDGNEYDVPDVIIDDFNSRYGY